MILCIQCWRFYVYAILLACIFAPCQGVARSVDQTQVCDAAARQAAEKSDVPLGILLSIARVETGRNMDGSFAPWPWSANVAGKGYFFATQKEAISFAQGQLAKGSANFDVGCFQINLRWHSKHFRSLEDAFDPSANASYAAQFLTELHQSEGSWSAAVAAYHSRTTIHADQYLEKVKSVWKSISGSAGATQDEPVIVAQKRENRFPLLRGGQAGGHGSLVPQTGGNAPLMAQP